MIVWLYTEEDAPQLDGPFFSLEEAAGSFLWEWSGACVWLEEHTDRGWSYENVKFINGAWFITSKALRPVEPFRPSGL